MVYDEALKRSERRCIVQVISLMWGILAIIGMLIAFLPCLGSLNVLNIPFAGVGLIVSAISLAASGRNKGGAIAGLVCCTIAIFFGLIRLILGGGIF